MKISKNERGVRNGDTPRAEEAVARIVTRDFAKCISTLVFAVEKRVEGGRKRARREGEGEDGLRIKGEMRKGWDAPK